MNWLLLNSGKCDAAFNMALDEALLEAMPRLGKPVLRFYGWTEPAATFGYSQRCAEVERMTALRPLVRRPTGGGLVPHDGDWTYTLVFPPSHPWYRLPARQSYERVHDWLQCAFATTGFLTRLAPGPLPGAGQCFAGAEQYDVLRGGTKVAGAAQRRSRTGLLIQGSVQPPPDAPAKMAWQHALCDQARIAWGVEWHAFDPGNDLLERAQHLASRKYSRREFNERR